MIHEEKKVCLLPNYRRKLERQKKCESYVCTSVSSSEDSIRRLRHRHKLLRLRLSSFQHYTSNTQEKEKSLRMSSFLRKNETKTNLISHVSPVVKPVQVCSEFGTTSLGQSPFEKMKKVSNKSKIINYL